MLDQFTIWSFVLATASVAIITYFWVARLGKSDNATEEFFTGGRMLSWPVVAGSLLLTNISTEQLVGLNGAVFKDGNLVGIAWEALAAFAMIATALLFLPRYLASGFTTSTAFLEKRFDRQTRLLVSGLFLFGYVSVLLPSILYTGSLAFKTMFRLDFPLWTIVTTIGLLGSAYAIFGGLKAVAISDTINGVGLLIGGLSIPVLSLIALGEGSLSAGLSTLSSAAPNYTLAPLATLDRSGQPTSVPWPTLLTGMMFIQVFYWSTNQVVVQRAMGARSLAEGQKGVLFASLMKLIGPLMLCLPGLIALRMFNTLKVSLNVKLLETKWQSYMQSHQNISADLSSLVDQLLQSKPHLILLEQAEQLSVLGLSFNDQIYPSIVSHVLPSWSLGLFAAVLMGSILSSFNSALNSASTLFSLEFYEARIIDRFPEADSRAHYLVKVGQWFSISLAIISMIIAPMLAELESIFAYLQQVNGLYSVPIISIFLVGILTSKAPAKGAKYSMVIGMVSYGYFSFIGIEGLHWLHGYAISFALAVATLLTFASLEPRTADAILADQDLPPAPVDMTPWKHAKTASWVIVILTCFIYLGLTLIAH